MDVFALIILPLLIFLSRIFDVSIGTLRIILVGKGYKFLAPILGFFEVTIWVLAIQQVMVNLNTPLYIIAYALGFSCGTFVGIWLEEKLSMGKVLVRIITKDSKKLIDVLHKEELVVTSNAAEGPYGRCRMIYSVIPRKKLKTIIPIIIENSPNSFYTVEDVRYASEENKDSYKVIRKKFWGMYRKGK